MNIDNKLKPCSCGGEAKYIEYNAYDGNTIHRIGQVICTSCTCNISSLDIGGYLGVEHTKEDIINTWNRRWNEDVE